MRGGLALKSGAKPQALKFAQQSVAAARRVHSGDAVSDGFLMAKACLLLGDVQRDLGSPVEARASWSQALAAIPAGVPERPDEIASHAKILSRLGRDTEAAPLKARLQAMGYRGPGI